MSKISELVTYSKTDTSGEYKEINFSNVPNFQAMDIMRDIGIDVKGAEKILGSSGIIHAFNSHGDHSQESPRGQIGIVDADFEHIPNILLNPDSFEKGNISKKGDEAVLFKKKINNKTYHVVMNVKKGRSSKKLAFGTMYIKK